ncbi:hypothetical protein FRC03_009860, partial [Tulasnella sp. 419]
MYPHHGCGSVALSENGSTLVSAGEHCTDIWDVETGSLVKSIFVGAEEILFVTVSSDGSVVTTINEDGELVFWNASTGVSMGYFYLHSHGINMSCPSSMAFSYTPLVFTSGHANGVICIWDLIRSDYVKELKGPGGNVESLAFSKDYSQVASGSNDGVLYIWDVVKGSIEKVMKEHNTSIRSIAFSHDSLLIASGSDDCTIITWNAITGLPVKVLKHDKGITDLAFSHDGLQIASATSNKCIYLWDTTHGTVLRTLQGMHDLDVRTVLFSPDNRHIISASNSICIWDKDAKDFTRPFTGHTAAISVIALSHDNKLIATGSDDHT